MDTIEVGGWEEFQSAVSRIRSEVRNARVDSSYVSPPVFRGQSDSAWKLSTTLDRRRANVLLVDYFRKVAIAKNELEAFSGNEWKFDLTEAITWSEHLPHQTIPGYELLVYLRHHGFPSPLLDWTRSPNIAAFFAFRDTPKDVASVSVYAFCDYVSVGRLTSSPDACIHQYGPNVKGHPRHFLQQSCYTICTIFNAEHKQKFASHEDAIQRLPNKDLRQDWLWKINIPASERGKVLSHLNDYNLNAFSLFADAASLAESLGEKHFGVLPD